MKRGTRSYSKQDVEQMTIGEALQLRAIVREEIRRAKISGKGSRQSRDGAARLMLALDAKLGSDEQRTADARAFLYGEQDSSARDRTRDAAEFLNGKREAARRFG